MKKFTYIGTWRMSFAGMKKSIELKSSTVSQFILESISHIENYEFFKSVGKGGLPNENGQVEMDAGYMDGKNKNIGAIMSVKGIANPVKVAEKLSKNKYNRMLAAHGAEKFAKENDFLFDKMETKRSIEAWKRKKESLKRNKNLSPYDGHDTVCFLGTDTQEEMIAATSTSGLFMKKEGRVGDSPIPGSGFYADNRSGSAAATGLGEDIIRGNLSFETVKYIEKGYSPMEASNKALFMFIKDMKKRKQEIGPISIIALNKNGEWGVATNCLFQFSVYTQNKKEPILYVSQMNREKNGTIFKKTNKGYWEDYINSLKEEII